MKSIPVVDFKSILGKLKTGKRYFTLAGRIELSIFLNKLDTKEYPF